MNDALVILDCDIVNDSWNGIQLMKYSMSHDGDRVYFRDAAPGTHMLFR